MGGLHKFKNAYPQVDAQAFVAPGCQIIGDVTIGAESSVWYGTVIRGDVNDVKIGKRTNIQDNCTIHVSTELQGTYIGDGVTVGHAALLHACTIGDGAFIGMQACVMDGVVIEDGAMVAACALVPPGKTVPSGQLWAGSPARYMRDLTEKDYEIMRWSADHYAEIAQEHKDSLAEE